MHSHIDIDGPLGALAQFLLTGIVLGYFVIAGQFWFARLNIVRAEGIIPMTNKNTAERAFIYLIAIFILCAMCGYAPRLVEFPIPLLIVLHGGLFIATWSYILLRQAAVIAVALARP